MIPSSSSLIPQPSSSSGSSLIPPPSSLASSSLIPHPSSLSSPSLPPDVVLSVRDVSKKFCRTLKRSMGYGIRDLACNLVGLRQNPTELRQDEFWALRDINFEVKRGEAVGIIGVNGSGKSTLFRVIHGLFPPDGGEVVVRGRIGALIALGAGFHPHMTGRENVFLNGSIMGISQDEIRERLHEIVEFAEIGEFIDAPLSTYSSGMRARLGFAVAINMDPDILLIDEVLAVGDLAFRNKCLLYMRKLRMSGTTLLFVTHSMQQIYFLCDRVVLLDRGEDVLDGTTDDVVREYYVRTNRKLAAEMSTAATGIVHIYESGKALYRSAKVMNQMTETVTDVNYGARITISIEMEFRETATNPWFMLFFQEHSSREKAGFSLINLQHSFVKGVSHITFDVASLDLQPGVYVLGSRISEMDGVRKLAAVDDLLTINVIPEAGQFPKTNEFGYFQMRGTWRVSGLDKSTGEWST